MALPAAASVAVSSWSRFPEADFQILPQQEAVVKARAGDELVVKGHPVDDQDRRGVITEVRGGAVARRTWCGGAMATRARSSPPPAKAVQRPVTLMTQTPLITVRDGHTRMKACDIRPMCGS
jgi:hypothetical protein